MMLRFMAGGLLMMGVAAAIVHVYIRWRVDNGAFVGTLRPRQLVDYVRDELPRLERPVLAIGSSHTMNGFVPDAFDRAYAGDAGHAVQSVNLGLNGLGGEFRHQTIRRIALELRGRQADLAILELAPNFETSDLPAWFTAELELYTAVMAPSVFFLEEWLQSPTRATRMLAHRTVMHGIEPGMVASDLRGAVLPMPAWWSEEADPRAQAMLAYQQNVQRSWRHARRGGPPDASEQQPQLAKLRAHEDHILYFENYEACCGFASLRIDSAKIALVIDSVLELAGIAKHVVVIIYPWEHATTATRVSAEARARVTAASERIQRETGVCVVNFMDAEGFEVTDFVDTIHLSPEGAIKFSTLLAARLAAWERAGYPRDCTGLR